MPCTPASRSPSKATRSDDKHWPLGRRRYPIRKVTTPVPVDGGVAGEVARPRQERRVLDHCLRRGRPGKTPEEIDATVNKRQLLPRSCRLELSPAGRAQLEETVAMMQQRRPQREQQ
jgi:hypothetical protein